MRVSHGFWGTREHWQNIEGNKGTLANFWEQRNKIRKITVRKHSENVWEQGNKDPPGKPSHIQVMRKIKLSTKGYGLDITPNSQCLS